MAMTHLNLNIAGGQAGGGSLAARDSGATHALTGLDALLREPSFTFSGANQRGLANGPGLEDDWPPIDVVGNPQRESLGDAAPPWLRVSNGDLADALGELKLSLENAQYFTTTDDKER
jgi:hypothetical protein